MHTVDAVGDLEQPVGGLLEEELAEERHPCRRPLPPTSPAPSALQLLRLTRPPIGSGRGANCMRRERPPPAASSGIRLGLRRRPRWRQRGMGTPLPLLTARCRLRLLLLHFLSSLPQFFTALRYDLVFLNFLYSAWSNSMFPGRREGRVLRDDGGGTCTLSFGSCSVEAHRSVWQSGIQYSRFEAD
jgi:hypothetical protein